jgi:hydrogenase/urease accessory protein HupE
MKKISLSMLSLAAMSAAAHAHPGEHGLLSFVQGALHLVTEPDHLAMIAIGAMAVAAGVWWKLRAT